MRPLALSAWLAGHLLYVVALYLLLFGAEQAQRTHNYSTLKQFEIEGLVVTNAASLTNPGQPGYSLIALKPLQTFHRAALVLSAGWTFLCVVLVFNWAQTERARREEQDSAGTREMM